MHDAVPEMEKCHRADSEQAILKMAMAGLGVAGFLDFSVERYLAEGTLVRLWPERIPFSKTIYLVFRAQTHSPRLHSAFKAFVTDCFQDRLASVA